MTVALPAGRGAVMAVSLARPDHAGQTGPAPYTPSAE